jgi:hypothetical protein
MLRRIAGLSAIMLAVSAAPAAAQAFVYPAMQPSRIAEREYNFMLADIGDGGGTGLIFQWREGLGNPKMQFTLDAGVVDPDNNNADARLVLGGGLAYQLASATSDMPFDIVLAGGLGFTTGDDITTIRVPFGAVFGHRFPLDGQVAITPFVHPRLMMEFCGDCGNDSEVGLGFDIGADFEFTPRMSMRLGVVLGGTDYFEDQSAFGLSLAWRPSRVTR